MKTLTPLSTKLSIFFTLFFACTQINAQVNTFQESIGGTQEEYDYDGQQTSDGGYVFGGVTLSYPFTNNGNSYVVKTDNQGDTMWTSIFGDTCGAIHYVNDIFQTSDNGYITCGGKAACSGNTGGNIVRLDANGNVIWAKTCSHYEDPYPCLQDKAGKFIVGGYVTGIGAGMLDACIMKLDANGDTIWSRTYGGPSNDWFYHIVQTKDGGYIASGFTSSFGQGDTDVYIVKTDSNGKLLWSKAYGTATYNESAFGHSLDLTDDGGYIVTGSTGATQGVFLMKLDASGNMLWARQYDGSYGHAVKQTPDKGFVIAGQSSSPAGVQLIKTDSLGNVQWGKIYNAGSSRYEGFLLGLTNDGGYITGGENTTANFRDMYIIKTDGLGNSGCNEVTQTIATSALPFITANAATQVGVGANTLNYAYLHYRGGNVSSDCLVTDVNNKENVSADNIVIYPNPVVDYLNINYGKQARHQIKVTDVAGRKLIDVTSTVSIDKLYCNKLASGVYFVLVSDSIGYKTFKVIK